jgi:hypothetical protein
MSSSRAVLSVIFGSVLCVIVLAAVELGTGDVQGASSCHVEKHTWSCNQCVSACTSPDVCTATRTSSCFKWWTEPDECSCITVWSPEPSTSENPTTARGACLKACRGERDSCWADAHEDHSPTGRCHQAFRACVKKCPGPEDER